MIRIMFLISILSSLCLWMIFGCNEEPSSVQNDTDDPISYCTAPASGDPNPYAMARVRSVGDDLDGIQANIFIKYGQLCCLSDCYSEEQFSIIYIALVRDNPSGWNGRSHIACGYGSFTYSRDDRVYQSLFIERIGNYSANLCDQWRYDFWEELPGIPPEGTQHTFALRFNRTNAKWEAMYDDTVFCDYLLWAYCAVDDTLWTDEKGEYVDLKGEISALESDMCGTWASKVRIFDWKIRKSYSEPDDWDAVNWNENLDDNTFSWDFDQWSARVEDCTVDTLYIYDVDPL